MQIVMIVIMVMLQFRNCGVPGPQKSLAKVSRA